LNRFPLFPDGPYGYTQRFGPSHLGIDIMAPLGTPIVAVDDGKAWRQIDSKGGNVVYLQNKGSSIRGTLETYYYAHLSTWFPTLASAIHQSDAIDVRAGDVLGFVGNTGNAAGGPHHLHFQIRRGSLVIDPFPDLQAVDPHPERGTPGQTVHAPTLQLPSMFAFPDALKGIALLGLLYLWARK